MVMLVLSLVFVMGKKEMPVGFTKPKGGSRARPETTSRSTTRKSKLPTKKHQHNHNNSDNSTQAQQLQHNKSNSCTNTTQHRIQHRWRTARKGGQRTSKMLRILILFVMMDGGEARSITDTNFVLGKYNQVSAIIMTEFFLKGVQEWCSEGAGRDIDECISSNKANSTIYKETNHIIKIADNIQLVLMQHIKHSSKCRECNASLSKCKCKMKLGGGGRISIGRMRMML